MLVIVVVLPGKRHGLLISKCELTWMMRYPVSSTFTKQKQITMYSQAHLAAQISSLLPALSHCIVPDPQSRLETYNGQYNS